jgi:hypothetical protein
MLAKDEEANFWDESEALITTKWKINSHHVSLLNDDMIWNENLTE